METAASVVNVTPLSRAPTCRAMLSLESGHRRSRPASAEPFPQARLFRRAYGGDRRCCTSDACIAVAPARQCLLARLRGNMRPRRGWGVTSTTRFQKAPVNGLAPGMNRADSRAVPTPLRGRWHATQVIRVRQRLAQ
jgi:hypothetical protein